MQPKPTFRSIFKQAVSNQTVYVMMLGVCTALATTSSLMAAFSMGIIIWVTLLVTNPLLALLTPWINEDNKLIVYGLVMGSVVSVVAMLLNTFFPFIHNTLGMYLPLIAVNCILITRIEVVAAQETPRTSFIDALGTGMMYTVFLMVIGLVRELFGTGAIVFFDGTSGDAIFTLTLLNEGVIIPLLTQPIGAYLTIGLLLPLLNIMWKRGAR